MIKSLSIARERDQKVKEMYKKILIAVATESELASVKKVFEVQDADIKYLSSESGKHGSVSYYKKKLDDREITIVKSGIGKGAMCFTLGAILNAFDFDLVINAGVAGALNHKIKRLSTLIASKTAFYDVDLRGIEECSLGQLDGMPLYFECDDRIIDLANKKRIQTGLILSGDLFITKENCPKKLDELFDNPIAIDMESAAVGEACYLAKIPYAIVRTISDEVESGENAEQYFDDLAKTCDKALEFVKELIKEY